MELPLIKILPFEDKKLIAEVFAGIATYEWAVFTSANGAREFMRLFFLALVIFVVLVLCESPVWERVPRRFLESLS